MEELEAEKGGWARTAKDLFAGAAGGVAQVLLGQSNAASFFNAFDVSHYL